MLGKLNEKNDMSFVRYDQNQKKKEEARSQIGRLRRWVPVGKGVYLEEKTYTDGGGGLNKLA